MRHILVFRFSAMGDVALTVPVIHSIVMANPDIHITMVTRPLFEPFFRDIPNTTVITTELKGRHRGIRGLIRLYKDLNKIHKFEAVIDLHAILRTVVVSTLFRISGKTVFSIHKGRWEKFWHIRKKLQHRLKHTTQRYLDVFHKAGIKGDMQSPPFFPAIGKIRKISQRVIDLHSDNGRIALVGFAPYAKHDTKTWGKERVEELIRILTDYYQCKVLLFGGGHKEVQTLKQISNTNPAAINMSAKYDLYTEIEIISRLKLMIAMDSANMHISALTGTPTISIWGGTHPNLGFSALNQPEENSIQPIEKLQCRPCSVYGAKPCIYFSPRCMELITPNMVAKRIGQMNLLEIRRTIPSYK
ncbi:glycosyltransferase family 9 protein [Puteibacter caeruleilacunae]|nr:glycosyltransferase family 9 protein [Puteibacter caeruleilacunae]